MSLVGKKAPDFRAKAVIKNQIYSDFSLLPYLGKNVVFFFYPLDFTYVCPTELHAFQDHYEEFEKRNAQVIACSVDSVYSHLAWLNTPRNKGGIEGVEYPIISDMNKLISEAYDILVPGEGIAFRGLFLIDSKGIVRHEVVNDLPLGRSIEDTLRILDALNHHEAYGEVCPANWQAGKRSMKPSQEGLHEYYTVEKA